MVWFKCRCDYYVPLSRCNISTLKMSYLAEVDIFLGEIMVLKRFKVFNMFLIKRLHM